MTPPGPRNSINSQLLCNKRRRSAGIATPELESLLVVVNQAAVSGSSELHSSALWILHVETFFKRGSPAGKEFVGQGFAVLFERTEEIGFNLRLFADWKASFDRFPNANSVATVS